MKDLAASIDMNEVTQKHKKIYFNNFFDIPFYHYLNSSFNINNTNSNNDLFLCSHHRGSNITKLPGSTDQAGS